MFPSALEPWFQRWWEKRQIQDRRQLNSWKTFGSKEASSTMYTISGKVTAKPDRIQRTKVGPTSLTSSYRTLSNRESNCRQLTSHIPLALSLPFHHSIECKIRCSPHSVIAIERLCGIMRQPWVQQVWIWTPQSILTIRCSFKISIENLQVAPGMAPGNKTILKVQLTNLNILDRTCKVTKEVAVHQLELLLHPTQTISQESSIRCKCEVCSRLRICSSLWSEIAW